MADTYVLQDSGVLCMRSACTLVILENLMVKGHQDKETGAMIRGKASGAAGMSGLSQGEGLLIQCM